ncbi:hypothetical protein DSECCO2_554280 [anaerobic digester metagenome]
MQYDCRITEGFNGLCENIVGCIVIMRIVQLNLDVIGIRIDGHIERFAERVHDDLLRQ